MVGVKGLRIKICIVEIAMNKCCCICRANFGFIFRIKEALSKIVRIKKLCWYKTEENTKNILASERHIS